MTVTKRKRVAPAAESSSEPSTTKKAAVEYTCDCCGADISHTVRIHCAHTTGPPLNDPVCDDFDLCGNCFLEGKELGKHKNWHDYSVVENPAFPIYEEDWGADEELLLIEACQTYGIGSWADIAEHVGTRTKQDVEDHYLRVYIEHGDVNFLPVERPNLNMDREAFQIRKKRRLEEYASRPPTMPAPKPLASGPSCHEIAGVLPGRLEFDVEWENDAEQPIKDMDFGLVWRWGGADQPEKVVDAEGKEVEYGVPPKEGDSSGGGRGGKGQVSSKSMTSTKTVTNGTTTNGADAPAEGEEEEETKVEDKDKESEEPEMDNDGTIWEEDDLDLELKITALEIFNARYDRRLEAKALVFDRNLLDYKKLKSKESKLSKEHKDIVNRCKVFAKIQTAMDHEVFVDGILYEAELKRRILELQEYRRMGITTFADANRYENVKAQRNANRPTHVWEKSTKKKIATDPVLQDIVSDAPTKLPPLPSSQFANAASLHLLSPTEQQLAIKLRILPKPFLYIKGVIMQEWIRSAGTMTREDALELFEFLMNQREKVAIIFDYLKGSGILKDEDPLLKPSRDHQTLNLPPPDPPAPPSAELVATQVNGITVNGNGTLMTRASQPLSDSSMTDAEQPSPQSVSKINGVNNQDRLGSPVGDFQISSSVTIPQVELSV